MMIGADWRIRLHELCACVWRSCLGDQLTVDEFEVRTNRQSREIDDDDDWRRLANTIARGVRVCVARLPRLSTHRRRVRSQDRQAERRNRPADKRQINYSAVARRAPSALSRQPPAPPLSAHRHRITHTGALV